MKLREIKIKLVVRGVEVMESKNKQRLWAWNENAGGVMCITEGMADGWIYISEDISLSNGRLASGLLRSLTEEEHFDEVWDNLTTYFDGTCCDDSMITLWSCWEEFVSRMNDVFGDNVYIVNSLPIINNHKSSEMNALIGEFMVYNRCMDFMKHSKETFNQVLPAFRDQEGITATVENMITLIDGYLMAIQICPSYSDIKQGSNARDTVITIMNKQSLDSLETPIHRLLVGDTNFHNTMILIDVHNCVADELKRNANFIEEFKKSIWYDDNQELCDEMLSEDMKLPLFYGGLGKNNHITETTKIRIITDLQMFVSDCRNYKADEPVKGETK